MTLDTLLYILIGILFVQSIKQNKHYNVIIDHVECESQGPSCLTPICSLNTIKRNEKLLTAGCNLTEPSYVKLIMTYNIKRNGIYRPTIINNLELDFCAFNDGNVRNPFINLLMSINSFRTSSNLTSKCPYIGFTGLHNFVLDSAVFPEFIPPGQYRLDGKAVHGNGTKVMIVKLYCDVKPKGAFVPV